MARKVRSDTRPMPDGFREDAGIPATELRRKYGAGTNAVRRWLTECKVGRERGHFIAGRPNCNRRPMPADFAEVFADKGWERTRLHYRCGNTAMARWLDECNRAEVAQPLPAIAPPPVVELHAVAPRRVAAPPSSGDWMSAYIRSPAYQAIKRKLPPVRYMDEARVV